MSDIPGGYCPRCGVPIVDHGMRWSTYPPTGQAQWRTVVCADGEPCTFSVAEPPPWAQAGQVSGDE